MTRIDHHAIADIGRVGDDEARRVRIRRHDHRGDRQIVFAGEIEVALVAGGAAENGAGAVIHQHEIGDIDRDRPVRVERMNHIDRGLHARFLGRFQRCHRGPGAAAFVAERGHCGVLGGQFSGQRMIGGNRQERSAIKGIGPCGVDFDIGRAASF